MQKINFEKAGKKKGEINESVDGMLSVVVKKEKPNFILQKVVLTQEDQNCECFCADKNMPSGEGNKRVKEPRGVQRPRGNILEMRFSKNPTIIEDLIGSPNLFSYYTKSTREKFVLFFQNTVVPHAFSIGVFLAFHFFSSYVSLSCFMPELKCSCANSDYHKKVPFVLKELLVQGNFLIFPYYIVFSIKDFKFFRFQKQLYFMLAPLLMLFLFFSDGEKAYPSLLKNAILIGYFVLNLVLNVINNRNEKRSNLFLYLKISLLLSGISAASYLITNFQLVNIKNYIFQFELGEFYFAALISLINKVNSLMLELVISVYEKLWQAQGNVNFNPFLYFIKFYFSVIYGFRLASVGQMQSFSGAFFYSIFNLILGNLQFHLQLKLIRRILNYVFCKVFKLSFLNKRVPAQPVPRKTELVHRFISFQRIDMLLIYAYRLIHVYSTKKLTKQHSPEMASLVDCNLDLKNEPNFKNLFFFLFSDVLVTLIIILYLKLKKKNNLKYIVEDQHFLFKSIVIVALSIQFEFYTFHLVSVS